MFLKTRWIYLLYLIGRFQSARVNLIILLKFLDKMGELIRKALNIEILWDT